MTLWLHLAREIIKFIHDLHPPLVDGCSWSFISSELLSCTCIPWHFLFCYWRKLPGGIKEAYTVIVLETSCSKSRWSKGCGVESISFSFSVSNFILFSLFPCFSSDYILMLFVGLVLRPLLQWMIFLILAVFFPLLCVKTHVDLSHLSWFPLKSYKRHFCGVYFDGYLYSTIFRRWTQWKNFHLCNKNRLKFIVAHSWSWKDLHYYSGLGSSGIDPETRIPGQWFTEGVAPVESVSQWRKQARIRENTRQKHGFT